ncbi:P-loop NTPase fold protein [Rhizobium rhizogenes]|uniref:KAP family P-loop NTPase fold protein n=1 Tax=Rhizobium rhizogenes TaxID=359 RepID=UPI0022BECBE7|nr:P-loop NTPase fold protein [Rhizobium rhizogenes]MCZ7462829.1 P-loop NTPase fold protein [Rhizobium rhizogenes]
MADHWASDRLGRRQDAEFLYNFVIGEVEKRRAQGRIASYVLNVDADWGGGKSFFLDGLAQDLEEKGHLVARVNAWRDDHAQDPYVAIMAAIDNVYEPFIEKPGKIATAWRAAKTSGGAIALKVGGAIVKGLIKKHVGISKDDLAELVVEEEEASETLKGALEDGAEAADEQLEKLFDASLEAMIEGFKRTDVAMTDFRSKLEKAVSVIAAEKPAPLFILVDELDRCRPTYAVQLLERVKHLFDVPDVVFVFATNADQLQHSISGSYGANFDGFRYLKRFFDRTYVFEAPSTEKLVADLSVNLPKEKLIAPEGDILLALDRGVKAFDFDLRAIRQVLEMIDAAASAWPHRTPADLVLLFALCAQFYKTGKADWPSHQTPELAAWIFGRSRFDQFSQKKIDTSINYGAAYRISVGVFRSMKEIKDLSSRSDRSVSLNHVMQVFQPEWNGVRVEDGQPSIQVDLLGIVANAGRMVSASTPSKQKA